MNNDPTQQFPAPEDDLQPTPSYYNAPPPQGAPFTPDPIPAAKKRMSKGKKWAIGIGAVLAVGFIGSLGDKSPIADPAAAPAPVAATSSTSAFPTVEPSIQAQLDADAAAKAAADKAAADKAAAKAAADAAAAKKAADAKAAAERAAAAKAAAAVTDKSTYKKLGARDFAKAKAAAAVTDKSTYKKLGARDFAKVAKNPDNYVGKKYLIYGHVTQFDAATGTEAFRASTANTRKSEWYDYETNAIVNQGRDGIFDDVVQDDLVTLYVVVDGSFSYDTQIGGSTTVPSFTANMVTVTGSTS